MATLSDDDVRARLPEGWTLEGDGIHRRFAFDTFPEGIAFVNRLAAAAEEADHHPDIDIRYNKISVTLSTHSEGGVTDKDLSLAVRANHLAAPPAGD